jgi:hypothetical protein
LRVVEVRLAANTRIILELRDENGTHMGTILFNAGLKHESFELNVGDVTCFHKADKHFL